MLYKSKYFIISIILLVLCSLNIWYNFPAIQQSPHSNIIGPAIVVFYLTYLTDVLFYFYYLKNKHLDKRVRDIIITTFRVVLTGILWITF